jgi:methionyl aminopeptidase
MNVGECFAIETFASTGLGLVDNDFSMKCNHFMKNYDPPFVDLKFNTSKKLLNYINKSRGTLPFCTRWINDNHNSRYETCLSDLVNKGIVQMYPPLVDEPNSYTSQLEHTIYLHEYGKEILSKGNDY